MIALPEGSVRANFSYRGRDFGIAAPSADDHLFKAIAARRCFYEIDLLEYMLRIGECFAAGNSVAVDVGGNIGNHSVFFGSFLTRHVISIEPNPAVVRHLAANLAANRVSSTLRAVAVGSSRGRAAVVMPSGARDNLGMACIDVAAAAATTTVDVETLDTLLDEWRGGQPAPQRVTLLKIDVEGMELEVLRGAARLLAGDRPHIFAEAANRRRYRELRDHLRAFGYVALSRWATTPVYHFAHDPPHSLRWRAAALKLAGEIRRPTEIRRFGRIVLSGVLGRPVN